MAGQNRIASEDAVLAKEKKNREIPGIGHNQEDETSRVARDELRALIERVESVEREIASAQEVKREVYAEAKARGYDTRAMRKIISDRKKQPEALSEFEAMVEFYRECLGI